MSFTNRLTVYGTPWLETVSDERLTVTDQGTLEGTVEKIWLIDL